MSKSIHLTVDLGVGDVVDYLYQDNPRKIWESLSDEDKWECFDYIWDHQDDSEYDMGFYDGDLCAMVEEWWGLNKSTESRSPRKLLRRTRS